ncbi:Pao retrotransposon peptidase family protein [Dirofilaria immitis]|nr:Pao retrotransposon peptidase family protein [Dirofilaria immitis]
MPENHEEVLVLFDIASQSSFISTKLANRLRTTRPRRRLEKPDILIGADYFFDFMSPYEFYKTSSRFYVILTKDKTMKVGNVTTTSDIEQFWKLELIGIQEQPNAIKRLRTDKLLFNRYNEVILQQVQSNIIEEVTPNMNQSGVIHYLPHHEVLTPGKSTTKLRIVYDASARLKAFLQLELFPSERNCTRFLWLKNIQGEVTDDNIVCYRFQRVPFGIISSPFLLSATLNYHLETHGSEIALEIRKNLYVDNIILPTKGTEEALKNYEKMKSIFTEASMNIRNFCQTMKNSTNPFPCMIEQR